MAPAVELQDSIGVSHQDHQREGINLLTAEGTKLRRLNLEEKGKGSHLNRRQFPPHAGGGEATAV